MSDERRTAVGAPARLAPDDIANRAFSTAFRGLSETEVRSFLRRVSEELQAAQLREAELRSEADHLRQRLNDPRPLDESELLEALGEETAKLLRSAREAAKDIRSKAEETAARMRAEATEESQTMRTEAAELLDVRTREVDVLVAEITERADREAAEIRAAADVYAQEQRSGSEADAADERERAQLEASTEIDDAKARGRAMVEEARSLRERLLADLAHRRGLLQGQITELRSGRDHLLEAYRVVKRTFLEATEALAQVEARAAENRPDAVDPADIEAALHGESPDEAAAALAESLGSDEFADDATLSTVNDLFARIRAETGAAETPDVEVADATEEAGESPPGRELMPAGDEEGLLDATAVATPGREAAPDGSVSAIVDTLVATVLRGSKRTAQDEQNGVLDALRRQKSRPTAAAVLPPADAEIAAWAATLGESVAAAYAVGAGTDSSAAPPAELAAELMTGVVTPLRERLTTAIEVGGPEDANDRVNARYREWKAQDLETALGDVLVAAYVRGFYANAAPGSVLQWVLATGGCCADCADNVLEAVTLGEQFPTGHGYPPAHAGCRCTLSLNDG